MSESKAREKRKLREERKMRKETPAGVLMEVDDLQVCVSLIKTNKHVRIVATRRTVTESDLMALTQLQTQN